MNSKDKVFSPKSLSYKGKVLPLDNPLVMGIINATPDSFFDGGENNTVEKALFKIEEMLNDGVDIIDVGGYSSRPGADDVSIQEEIDRTASLIQKINERFGDVWISIDTFRKQVAQEAIDNGASIINDITGGFGDEKLLQYAGANNIPYVLMHMRGTPKTMSQKTDYSNLVSDVIKELRAQVEKFVVFGGEQLIIDPGFGFAKTLEQNYELLNNLKSLEIFESPILVGVSRKSMLYKLLDTTPDKVLSATSAINLFALQKGASILRVHDVREAKEVVKLHEIINDTII